MSDTTTNIDLEKGPHRALISEEAVEDKIFTIPAGDEDEERAVKKSAHQMTNVSTKRQVVNVGELPDSSDEDENYYRYGIASATEQLDYLSRRKDDNSSKKNKAEERQQNFKTSELSDLNFHERVAATGLRHLFAKGHSPSGSSHSYDIALSTLQRMVIHQIQRKLVGVVSRMYRGYETLDRDLAEAQTLLAKYSIAIRDYDFMTERLDRAKSLGERDPFLITTLDSLSFYLMKEAHIIPADKSLTPLDAAEYKKGINILPGSSRSVNHRRVQMAQRWERLWMGLLGGLALIGPMLLMVLHKDLVTTLVTTSVATILFACALALLGADLNGQAVVASVAAYAAVLVVFVGAAQNGS